jgi:hypothetical protein
MSLVCLELDSRHLGVPPLFAENHKQLLCRIQSLTQDDSLLTGWIEPPCYDLTNLGDRVNNAHLTAALNVASPNAASSCITHSGITIPIDAQNASPAATIAIRYVFFPFNNANNLSIHPPFLSAHSPVVHLLQADDHDFHFLDCHLKVTVIKLFNSVRQLL